MTETPAQYAVEGEIVEPVALAIPVDWLQPNGLDLPDDLSEAEWSSLGQTLLYADEAIQFLVGDWYNAGVARWGARHVAARLEEWRRQYPYLRISQWKIKTIRNYASICKTFDALSRFWEHLGFWHYAKVCGYEPDEQQAHLGHANLMQMNPAQFEAYLIDQDKRRQPRDRDRRTDEMAAQNGRLSDENRDLNSTVDVLRDENEELRARVAQLESQVDDPRNYDLDPVDEAYSRDAGGGQVTCPECGAIFEIGGNYEHRKRS